MARLTKAEIKAISDPVMAGLERLPPARARGGAVAIRMHPKDLAAYRQTSRFPNAEHSYEGLPLVEDPGVAEGRPDLAWE